MWHCAVFSLRYRKWALAICRTTHHLVTSRCFITLPVSDAELASPHRIGMSLSFIGTRAGSVRTLVLSVVLQYYTHSTVTLISS